MQSEELKAAIEAATTDRDGKKILPCDEAFRLADELQVDLMDIGRICNRIDVKIARCQLGCFK